MRTNREVLLHNAYLLHSRPFRDSSLLVNLLSEEFGHISAIVYVGKSKKSNKKGLLQPFSCLQIELKGQSALKTLSRVEHAEKTLQFKGNYLFSGFYLNELLVRLLPENIPCESLFHFYQQSLIGLQQEDLLEPLLRRFEMTLLEELGLSLDFSVLENDDTDVAHFPENEYSDIPLEYQVEQPSQNYWQFIPEQGFVKAQFEQQYPLYDGEHLAEIAMGNLIKSDVLLTYKRLMRQVLQRYLGNKPLHSRQLFVNRLAK